MQSFENTVKVPGLELLRGGSRGMVCDLYQEQVIDKTGISRFIIPFWVHNYWYGNSSSLSDPVCRTQHQDFTAYHLHQVVQVQGSEDYKRHSSPQLQTVRVIALRKKALLF